MTGAAVTDIRVKRSGLCFQQGRVSGMADDTICGFHAFDWCMASSAILLQKCMGGRQWAGTRHVLPRRLIEQVGGASRMHVTIMES